MFFDRPFFAFSFAEAGSLPLDWEADRIVSKV
jgi:hypothetical protein